MPTAAAAIAVEIRVQAVERDCCSSYLSCSFTHTHTHTDPVSDHKHSQFASNAPGREL